jgi:integrase
VEADSPRDGDDRPIPDRVPAPIAGSARGELELFDQPRLERNPAAVYIRRLGSPSSRRVMRGALNLIATQLLGVTPQTRVGPSADPTAATARAGKQRTAHENVTYLYCAWSALRYPHTSAIRDWLAAQTESTGAGPARYAPATANRMLAALRGVLKEAWRLGEMSAEDYYRAADVQGVSATTLPRGRTLTHDELSALLADCLREPEYYERFPKRLPRDARDAALIAMLYSIGLRRFEVVALDLEDFNSETGAVHVRHGKRGKARLPFLASGAIAAMNDWLAVRGSAPGPLFTAFYKGGVMTGRRLSDQAVYHILQVRQRQAGVAPFSPHDLRRTCVGDLLDAGVDMTTARYDRCGDRAKKAAADKLHVPYVGRAPAPHRQARPS